MITYNNFNHKYYFLTKGAFESIKTGLKTTSNLNEAAQCAQEKTKTGARILALAFKELSEAEVELIDSETEEYFFCDLEFLGFLNFDNAIKTNVDTTIAKLKECGIESAIISGDNEYSCAFNAFKTGIMDTSETLYFIKYDPTSKEVVFEGLNFLEERLTIETLQNKENDVFMYIDKISSEIDANDTHASQATIDPSQTLIHCDLDRPTFPNDSNYNLMINNHTLDLLRRKRFVDATILNNTRVFARMTPSSKSDILELFKRVRTHDHKIAFVGDGSNDVRAMKIADIGISFYGCEASISAGFSIPFDEFPLIIPVLSEGKACLEICLELFKYIVFYSLSQFSCSFILYLLNIELSNGMYYIMDLFIIIPASISLCFHGSEKLVKKYPLGTLFTRPMIMSVVGNGIIIAMSLTASSVYLYKNVTDIAVQSLNIATTLFLLLSFDLIIMSILIVRGAPFRKSKVSNYIFMGHMTFSLILLIYFTFIASFGLLKPMNDWVLSTIAVL